MMGVAASGKCRILITMRFKVQQKGEHRGSKPARLPCRHKVGVRLKESVKFTLPILLLF
jgi:hypothetical protein